MQIAYTSKELLKILKLGEYHDLFVKGNTLVLADLFENFRNVFLELYELDPA